MKRIEERKNSDDTPSPVKKVSRKVQVPAAAIVGIGASAGGLEAFTDLLQHLPSDSGMGFVLIQHLDPSHVSILGDLLSKATSMRVTPVIDGMRVLANEVYVIPPNRSMTVVDGILRLQVRIPKSLHHPIDQFFISLAEDRKNRALGVILSGTASDGTAGLEAIKAEGGITFAQDESARYDGMPQSAIASGHVDFVLSPRKIAEEIAHISRHPYLFSRETPAPNRETQGLADGEAKDYGEILKLLHESTGVDFTHYRSSTIRRRIDRRIILKNLNGMNGYVHYLHAHPAETASLLMDLLIGVTSFFRNPEVFEALKERVFPSLVEKREARNPLRAWVYGCSTGQEAYSIAMAYLEFAEGRRHPELQIYATDLNELAIDTARSGIYPKSLSNAISADRLSRFFVETESGYRMNNTIREMCVFARQDLMVDPPFSRIDFISCRNTLIYMEPALQKHIIPMFHYALKPAGFLLLGSSETVGADTDLFAAIDKKHKIYGRKPALPRVQFGMGVNDTVPQRSRPGTDTLTSRRLTEFDERREADRILLTKYAPASVLVDRAMEIVQVRGSTGAYLEAPAGKATHNLLKMAREDLAMPIRTAVRQAKSENNRVCMPPVRLRHGAGYVQVQLEVTPVCGGPGHDQYFLILFQPGSSLPSRLDEASGKKVRTSKTKPDQEIRVTELEQQIEAMRQYAQSLAEQQETYNEELQSANEEVQSSNEELQSINAELETAKEELQSGNEELITINEELQNRSQETHQLNTDLSNLLTNIRIPVVMVDGDLRIRRFTPPAETVMNIKESDVGRPLSDLKLDIEIPDLAELLRNVIDNKSIQEREIQDKQGHWYKAYFGAYVTAEDGVAGAVIVLTSIHALKETARSLSDMCDYADAIIETARQPLMILDRDLRVCRANGSFYDTFHLSAQDTMGRFLQEVANGQWDNLELLTSLDQILPDNTNFQEFELQGEFTPIGQRTILLNARKLLQKDNQESLILLCMEDVTYRKSADLARDELFKGEKAARVEAEELTRMKDEFLATASHELRTPLNAILGWSMLLNRNHFDEAGRTRALESIERNAKIQAKLIEDMMDVSRIVAGKLRLSLREVLLRSVIEAAIDTVSPAAHAKQIPISFNINEASAIPILGDAQRLQQVMWNLLMNAIKFTPPGGRIDVGLEQTHAGVRIRVKDNGQGIRAGFLPHIFDRFRQADSSSTRRHGGMGLGLAIVRQLVELHDGTIRVESPGEGKGATFIVEFSGRQLQQEPRLNDFHSPKLLNEDAVAVANLENIAVLVVDDEPDTREMLAIVLEHYGGKVRTAASVQEAFAILSEWQPTVLISDIEMPEHDGYELMREIRKLPVEKGGNIPAIALTAYGKQDDRRQALEAGYQEHLVKPASPLQIISVVTALAATRQERVIDAEQATGHHA